MPATTPADLKPDLGTPVSEIETPALVVDLDVMERNVEAYAEFARRNDCRLRSHVKTHKTPDIARYQDERTGGGIACQTLGEAEVMAYNGLTDIYLSYMVVGRRKLRRAAHLATKLDRFAVTVDHPTHVRSLQEAAAERDATVGVVVEIDTGLGRTGVDPEDGDVVGLVESITARPNLRFDGLLAYEAQVKSQAETEADYRRLCHEAMDEAGRVVERIEGAGIDVPEVRAGGTATSWYSGTHPVVTEINPGMYPFNDVGEIRARPWAVSRDDCAATVLTDVISVPGEDRVVVDAGSKSLSLDGPHSPVPKRRDDVAYANASEEHGWIDTSASGESFAVGDRLEFVVPHVCTTVNLHDVLVGVRDGHVADVWEVQARGKVK
jgi:D-serine deaminase-like pyridoxal phosphate-dependent protein